MKLGVKPSALFAAAWWGNHDILADLVNHGEDINRFVGATPLHMAVAVLDRGIDGKPERAKRRLRTVRTFLELGADPNIRSEHFGTPLHTALEKGYDISVFKLLLKHGANPDVPGRKGRTVRDIASKKKNRAYFEAL